LLPLQPRCISAPVATKAVFARFYGAILIRDFFARFYGAILIRDFLRVFIARF
jgi:hypothetical protein